MLNDENLINAVYQEAILGNMWIGKGLEILPTLCSLQTELFALFSASSYCSWTLTKYAHSWMSSKIKFVSLLLWDVVQCRVSVFCMVPVCAVKHTRKKKISTAEGKSLKYCKTKCFMIATVLQNICSNYQLMHDSSSSNMQVRTKRWLFSGKILSASLSNTLLNSATVTLDDKQL